MTFLSLADGCRLLGIDAKTLRRWLAHAQLPLQRHPHDGRKTGLSSEHVQQLATLHHRSLVAWPQAARLATDVPAPLPAELLALPQTLSALQAQIATLQQQIADLTQRLQQHAHPPVVPVSAAPQAPARRRAPTSAPPTPRSRPAASVTTKPARKPTHVLPLVESESLGHYVVFCPKQGRLALEPDSPAWFAWLATQSSFRFVGTHGRLTAHREVERVPNGAWRAHRHLRNHSYNLRLGPTHDLTMATLEQAAATLQAQLK